MVGLVVGSYQGCSEALETLVRKAAEAIPLRRQGARAPWWQAKP